MKSPKEREEVPEGSGHRNRRNHRRRKTQKLQRSAIEIIGETARHQRGALRI
jgi:hypothetical protein